MPLEPRPRFGLASFNIVTVLAWFGIPALLMMGGEPGPDVGETDVLMKVILWVMGSVSALLIGASILLIQRRPVRRVVINIAVQLLILTVVPLFIAFPVMSVFVFVPIPAVLTSIWGLTRPDRHAY